MAEVSQNTREQPLASEELIAQAYAAIAGYGVTSQPPAPTGTPISVQTPSSTQTTQRRTSSQPATYQAASSAPTLQEWAKTKPTAGPKTIPTQAPYRQGAKELRQSSPFQPPPPNGAPLATASKPIVPSRQAVTTGPDSRQPNTPRPSSQRPAGQQPQKKSGWVTALVWLIIIVFILFILPNLNLFD